MQAALAGLPPVAARAVVAAEAALRTRRLDEAQSQLTVAASLAPSHPEVLHLQANLDALHGRYVEAVTALQQAMVQRPRDPLIFNSLGLVLRRTGRLDDATQAFQHALKLDSRLAGTWPARWRFRCSRTGSGSITSRPRIWCWGFDPSRPIVTLC